MNSLSAKLTGSPVAARCAPFLVFIAFTFAQPYASDTGRYWLYLAKTLVAIWMLWTVRGVVPEMRWNLSWIAVAGGVGVFLLWVGLDACATKLGWVSPAPPGKASGSVWNPQLTFGPGSALAWLFVGVRIAGSALIVPLLEEVFFRSFIYRYLARADFLSVPIGTFFLRPFLVTSLIFGLEHRPADWAAGVLCGFIYQGIVCRKKRLGDAVTAHGLTNLLLGLWVVWKGAWQFW